YTVASVRGSEVHRVGTGKVEVSAGTRELKKVALLAPQTDAEYERMLAFDPSHRVRCLEDVFKIVLRQPLGVAQRGDASDVNIGKAAGVGITGAVHVGDSQLRSQIFAEIEGQGIDGIPEESTVQVIQEALGKRVGITKPHVLRARVADARAAIGTSPERPQWTGLLAAHITEAVRGKYLVLLAESMIEANIERVLVIDVVLICQIILGQRGGIRRLWI